MAQADANKKTTRPQYAGIMNSKTRSLFKNQRRAFAMPG